MREYHLLAIAAIDDAYEREFRSFGQFTDCATAVLIAEAQTKFSIEAERGRLTYPVVLVVELRYSPKDGRVEPIIWFREVKDRPEWSMRKPLIFAKRKGGRS